MGPGLYLLAHTLLRPAQFCHIAREMINKNIRYVTMTRYSS